MKLFTWFLSIAKRWPWVNRRRHNSEVGELLQIRERLSNHCMRSGMAALKDIETLRAERDAALFEAKSPRAAAQGWFPQDTAEAIRALKTLAVFVDARWGLGVKHYPPVPKYKDGNWSVELWNDNAKHFGPLCATWTDAVAGAAQKVIDRDGKLPDPLPKQESTKS